MNVQHVGAWQTIKVPLPSGRRGTAKTIELIKQLVDEGLTDPRVRRVATEILRNSSAPAHDDVAEVRAIYQWVLANIRFTKDMVGKETLQPAWAILETGAGDCDCINSILLPSLLGSVGYPTRLVTIAADPDDPELDSHIYIEALVQDIWGNPAWIPLDAARPGAAWLRTPEYFFRMQRWPLMEAAEAPDAPIGRLGGRMAARYLNGLSAPRWRYQRTVSIPVRKSRMPHFGLGALGQDDSISASEFEQLAGPEAGPAMTAPLPGPQVTISPAMPTPVVVSTGPSSSFQSSTGSTLAQQLTPILQSVPGIESGAAQIVSASTMPGYGLPRLPYAQSGTAVLTASTGGTSIFLIAILGLAAVLGVRALSK